MRKCFILRGVTGKTVGYIQQTDSSVRCRYQGESTARETEIYLVACDGTICKRKINSVDDEQEWNANIKEFLGGCIVSHDAIVASSGEEAKQWIKKYLIQTYASSAKSEATVGRMKRSSADKAENLVRTSADKRESQQRRWPPNPCSPECKKEE